MDDDGKNARDPILQYFAVLPLMAQHSRDKFTLRLRTNLVTHHRFLKGDLDVGRDGAGYINQAQVIDRSVLNYLVTHEFLEDEHLQAAATYTLWQLAFQRPFYAEPRKVYLIELVGSVTNGSNDETAYRKLISPPDPDHPPRLSLNHQNYIDHAISADINQHNQSPVYQSRFFYRSAFDQLINLISTIQTELEQISLAEPR